MSGPLKFGVIMAAARERSSDLTAGLALATVAFTSGFISYTHICALTLQQHGSWKTAHLMPLAVDMQIVMGSVYFMGNEGRKRRWAGLLGIVPGIGESLIANWQSGIVHGLFAAGWATVPAQAFACSAFLFERWLYARKAARSAGRSDAELLALSLADAAGLRASLEAAQALAEASVVRAEAAVAAVAAVAPRSAPPAPAAPVLPAPVPWPPRAGPSQPLRTPVPAPRPAPLKAVDGTGPARRERKVGAVPEQVLAKLPQGAAALAELFRTHTGNEVARDYGISRYWSQHLSKQWKNAEGVAEVA
jgi:hypothetical protein